MSDPSTLEGVIVTAEGFPVAPGITVPAAARDVTINAAGEVLAKLDGQVAPQNVGQIQIAIFANEGGLARADFGRIDIRPTYSLVELPADLPAATFQRLADTRISGMLIDLRPDRGPRGRGSTGGARPGGNRPRKPRHPKRDR